VKRTLALLAFLALAPGQALAWGFTGHTMISRLGAESLPETLPAFLRSPDAIDELAYMGPEEDRIKGSGQSWDEDNDDAHFLDIGDDGKVAGVVNPNALPRDMEAYSDALSSASTSPYKVGFIPYAIMDGFERVRMDLAYWRVEAYLATHAASGDGRAKAAHERDLSQMLTLRDIGDWSHFVGDGSQPLHVTIHYNGWGDYPNPHNYTTNHIHSFFESEFVDKYAKIDAVRALMPARALPPADHLLTQDEISVAVGAYLEASAQQVDPLYALYASGAFTSGSKEAVSFTDLQLARGAAMLRDLTALAWESSYYAKVGYPAVPVEDILSGKAALNSSD